MHRLQVSPAGCKHQRRGADDGHALVCGHKGVDTNEAAAKGVNDF